MRIAGPAHGLPWGAYGGSLTRMFEKRRRAGWNPARGRVPSGVIPVSFALDAEVFR